LAEKRMKSRKKILSQVDRILNEDRQKEGEFFKGIFTRSLSFAVVALM